MRAFPCAAVAVAWMASTSYSRALATINSTYESAARGPPSHQKKGMIDRAQPQTASTIPFPFCLYNVNVWTRKTVRVAKSTPNSQVVSHTSDVGRERQHQGALFLFCFLFCFFISPRLVVAHACRAGMIIDKRDPAWPVLGRALAF